VYTLGEAARAVGKTRPALAKAIKTGRLSAVRGEDGSYQIDHPAELHRVYPVARQLDGSGLQKFPLAVTAETAAGLREELAKWHALAEEREETIRDLRVRLDASGGGAAAGERRAPAGAGAADGAIDAPTGRQRPIGTKNGFRAAGAVVAAVVAVNLASGGAPAATNRQTAPLMKYGICGFGCHHRRTRGAPRTSEGRVRGSAPSKV